MSSLSITPHFSSFFPSSLALPSLHLIPVFHTCLLSPPSPSLPHYTPFPHSSSLRNKTASYHILLSLAGEQNQ